MSQFGIKTKPDQWRNACRGKYRLLKRRLARIGSCIIKTGPVSACQKGEGVSPIKQQIRSGNRPRPESASICDRRSQRRIAMLQRSGLFGQDTHGATIERACNFADLEKAYRLVHDVYVAAGYIRPQLSGLRVRMFEASPEEATFVAKIDGRIVGVVSVAVDSPELGLPSDVSFKAELDALRAGGSRLSEMTNQVVSEEYRKSGVATELMRCAAAHVIQGSYDEAIATISPSHSAFYRILGFREIGAARSYSTAVYDPVVALSVDVGQYRQAEAELDEASRFIHHFLADGNPFMKRVAKWNRQARDQFRDAYLLRRLFITETGFITQCSNTELQFLEHAWGRRLFASATGRSFLACARTWTSALLNVLHILDDDHPIMAQHRQVSR